MTRAQQWFVLIVLAALDTFFSVAVYLSPSDYTMMGLVMSLVASFFFVGMVMTS